MRPGFVRTRGSVLEMDGALQLLRRYILTSPFDFVCELGVISCLSRSLRAPVRVDRYGSRSKDIPPA